jgi:putative membrane protein
MISPSSEILADWEPQWLLNVTIAAFAIIYVRGWFAIRKTRPARFPEWRLICYLLGLGVIWLAIASPLDGFADVLLSAHMIQHLLLMSAVPPLVLLGAPVVPLLRGLPRPFLKAVIGPLIRFKPLSKLGRFLTKPLMAWFAMNLTFLIWHAPRAYDFALDNEHVHEFEHICFLVTSLLFWWPVIEPWPTRPHNTRWGILLYLISADFVNTALSAFLAFCDRPVYTYYLTHPNPFQVSPVADQVVGAAVMWVLGSIVFLVPAVMLTWRLVQVDHRTRRI